MPANIQPLEARTMLSATVVDGVLTISPDLRSNRISVRSTDTSLVLEVRDNDTLRNFGPGSVRRVVILGGSRGDVIDAGGCPFPVTVLGGRGGDIITGGDANDRLFGGPGDDRLRGGPGGDVLSGEAGVDTVTYADSLLRPVVVTAGDGIARDGQVDLSRQSEGDDVRGDVEILVGGGGNDRLFATAGPMTLFGGEGDDFLQGGLAADVLVGGDGNDTLDGAQGNDVLLGVDRNGSDDLFGGADFDIAVRDRLIDDVFGVEFVQDE